jgi:hypothetical protein
MVQATLLRSDVSGTVQLLLRPPCFAGHQFGGQTPASGTVVPLQIDAEDFDPYNGHAIPSANYFPPLAGWYLAESSVAYQAASSAGVIVAGIQYVTNGAGAVSVGGGRVPIAIGAGNFPDQHPICSRLVQAVLAGPGRSGTDTINAYIRQSTGSNANVSLGFSTTGGLEACAFQVRWAGTGAASSLPVPPFVPAPNPPMMEYQLNATQNLPSAASLPDLSGTVVNLDTLIVDNYSAFNTGSNVWTAPVAGMYYCYGQVDCNTTASSQVLAAGLTVTTAFRNGGAPFTWWGGGVNETAAAEDNCATVVRNIRLHAGDKISLGAYQKDSGAAGHTMNGNSGNSRCRLITLWRGM